jgi:hypothetical protein
MTTVTMARHLPVLVLRSLKMAWRVDRVATAGLLACQVGIGVLAALGLLAVTGTLTSLISSGDISDRLWEAAPQLVVIATATGLRALLGVTVTWLTGRLRPVLARAAELTMIEAALGAVLAATTSGLVLLLDVRDALAIGALLQVVPGALLLASPVLALREIPARASVPPAREGA